MDATPFDLASVADRTASQSWPGEAPELAVVVPTHGRARFLPELIDALEHQEIDASRFEVVIVDDHSPDETWDVLRALTARTELRIIAARSASNRGPAAARNLAVGIARAPLLAFTDDDCLPSPNWAGAMLVALRAGSDVVQGPTLARPEDRPTAGPWPRTVRVEKPSALFESCNIGWSRRAFLSLGGFPESRPDAPRSTRLHFGEDAELGWKLRSDGGSAAFAETAVVYHRVLPGRYADWLKEQRRMGMFPGLLRRAPGLRRELTLRAFLSPRTALFDLALAGSVAAAIMWRPWSLAAALPWVVTRWRNARHRPGKPRVVRFAQLAVGDVVGFASLVGGSIRARRLVL